MYLQCLVLLNCCIFFSRSSQYFHGLKCIVGSMFSALFSSAFTIFQFTFFIAFHLLISITSLRALASPPTKWAMSKRLMLFSAKRFFCKKKKRRMKLFAYHFKSILQSRHYTHFAYRTIL